MTCILNRTRLRRRSTMIPLTIELPTTIKTIITGLSHLQARSHDCHTYKHEHTISTLATTIATKAAIADDRAPTTTAINNKHKLLLSTHPSTQVLPPCRLGPGAFERLRRCAEIKPESTGEPMDPARLGRCVDIKPKSTGRIPSVRPAALAGIDVRGPTRHVLRACHRRVGIARKFAVRREERQLPRYVMRGAVAIASEV